MNDGREMQLARPLIFGEKLMPLIALAATIWMVASGIMGNTAGAIAGAVVIWSAEKYLDDVEKVLGPRWKRPE